MKTSTSALRIEKQELSSYPYSFKSNGIAVERKNDKLKSRLGFVYFIALVSSLVVLILK